MQKYWTKFKDETRVAKLQLVLVRPEILLTLIISVGIFLLVKLIIIL